VGSFLYKQNEPYLYFNKKKSNMSVTIKNLPYSGLMAKINPVYNGLGFVVDSNFKSLNDFKYIAEIFVNGAKVGELRHNPDISNNKYGIFDIGRVVESYLSYDLNWNTSSSLASKSLVNYYVKFGEEFGRVFGIKSYQNNSSKMTLILNSVHPLVNGDVVLVQGVTGTTPVNKFSTITKLGSTGLICNNIPYVAGLNINNSYVLTGETVDTFLFWTDSMGVKKVRLKVKANSSLNIGDKVYIQEVTIQNNSYNNVEWTVEKRTATSVYTYLDISCPFGVPVSSTAKGYVVSRDNYLSLNQFSTQNHLSRAFNGVEQYEDWLSWSPNQWLLQLSSGKYLTKRPDRELDICLDEWMTVSLLGKREMTDFGLLAPTRQVVETWQHPTTPVSTIITASSSNSAYKPNILQVGVVPNLTGLVNPGDYVDIVGSISGTVRARVINASYSGSLTNVVLDFPYVAQTWSTFNLAIRAINRTYTFQNSRFDFGVGPKNLNIPEINNGLAYKYLVYSVSTSISPSSFWLWTRRSEVWTFNMECSCDKFKKWSVVWLNELGGFDFYNFTKRSDKVRVIERNQFRRHLKSYNTTTGYKYKLGDRGRTNYNIESKDQITLRTDFLNQDYIDWLQYAFESPEVYIIDLETDKIYPVNCIDSSVELLNKTNMGSRGSLYIYELRLEMANNRVVQRGGNLPSTANSGPYKPLGSFNTANNGVYQLFNGPKTIL
jgi:hypothetical protein